jgi:RIO-like serine/threonine protein kinase
MSCNVICCLYSLCIIKLFDANVMQIDDDEKNTVIDFPQMVSISHRNAQMYEASQITNVKVSCI